MITIKRPPTIWEENMKKGRTIQNNRMEKGEWKILKMKNSVQNVCTTGNIQLKNVLDF
jgi:hypothetical protein